MLSVIWSSSDWSEIFFIIAAVLAVIQSVVYWMEPRIPFQSLGWLAVAFAALGLLAL